MFFNISPKTITVPNIFCLLLNDLWWENKQISSVETQYFASAIVYQRRIILRLYEKNILEVRFKHIFIVKAENMFGSLFGSVH